MASPTKIWTVVLFALVTFVSLRGVEGAIKCYTCFYTDDEAAVEQLETVQDLDSKNDKSCVDNPRVLREAMLDDDTCAVVKGTLKSGKTFVIRAALGPSPKKVMCETKTTKLGNLLNGSEKGPDFYEQIKDSTTCVCFTEGCNKQDIDPNSGMTLTLTSLSMVSSLIAVTLSFSNFSFA